jgi:hypothetical protein
LTFICCARATTPGIEDAWQIAGLRLESKRPPYFNYLLPLTLIANIFSWYSIFITWQSAPEKINHPALDVSPMGGEFYQTAHQWSINPAFLFISLAAWTFVHLVTFGNLLSNVKNVKNVLICSLGFISLTLFFDLIIVAMAFDKMGWQGPVSLTVSLLVALVCTILQIKYYPRKIEVVLSAQSSK